MTDKDVRETRIILYLASGHKFDFWCEDFEITFNGLSGTYTAYKFINTDRTVGVLPSQIVAYEATIND